jgi:hypothetical protein
MGSPTTPFGLRATATYSRLVALDRQCMNVGSEQQAVRDDIGFGTAIGTKVSTLQGRNRITAGYRTPEWVICAARRTADTA